MLLRIPAFAHPAVTKFLISKFLEYSNISNVNTGELHKYLHLITKEDIENHLSLLSAKSGTSFSQILVPPVTMCIHCDRLLDPMIKKFTQVILFDIGGVKVASKFRYRWALVLESLLFH